MPLLSLPKCVVNRLAFPAGTTPWFDPNHIASGSVRFSGVATGANFVSLLRGQPGTRVGTPAGIISGVIGPAVNFVGTTDAITFAGTDPATEIPANITLAAIWRYPGVDATVIATEMSAGSNGSRIEVSGGVFQFVLPNVVGITSTISATTNTSYFFAASFSNGIGVNFVVRDLTNGRVFSQFVSNASTNTQSGGVGTFGIGNQDSGTSLPAGPVSAVMYSVRAMDLGRLLRWSSDPWSFWYPQRRNQVIVVSNPGSGPNFKTSLMPMMGVG